MAPTFALAAATLILSMFTVPAFAQERVFRTAKAAPGKQIRLSVAGNVTKECTPGPLPEMAVITPPKNGTLAIRDGNMKAGSLKRCPDLRVPVRGVFYMANPSFSGTEEVVYEVKRSDGRTQSISIRIEVGAGQGPATAPGLSIDL
jgi:hypothetical protein